MANIWKENRDVTQHPNRNNFDLSFQSHCTFKFGYLYPVFCRRVVPGDSFRIDSAFDLKMMPISFPIQSRIRAHMHYFYVRNKNLWKNWDDWITGLKSNDVCPHPYISIPDSEFKNGSIHDFLNQPTSIVVDESIDRTSMLFCDELIGGHYQIPYNTFIETYGGMQFSQEDSITGYSFSGFSFFGSPISQFRDNKVSFSDSFIQQVVDNYTAWRSSDTSKVTSSASLMWFDADGSAFAEGHITEGTYVKPIADATISLYQSSNKTPSELKTILDNFSLLPDLYYNKVNTYIETTGHRVAPVLLIRFSSGATTSDFACELPSPFLTYSFIPASGVAEWSDLGVEFYDGVLKLNALKYRAYESIYRSFYASDVWQPLVIDGQKEFNKFNTTVEDGADTTDYHLFRRNYEYDFLTSALPSPQAGPAPLVGVSSLNDVVIVDENGVTTGTAVLDDSGHITNIAVTSPIASVEHGRTIMNIASLGMSINDFRAANSLTRLVEQTMRSGYRYQPFIKGHHGVEPKYNVLDMPEFLGGFSRDVDIQQVTSLADTVNGESGMNLGDFGGIGRVVGGSNHSITHFCDDYGFVIGIMCITPTPAYSQLLPKENICPTNYLDYYFPEMSQVGMQPIPYTEVAPLQAYLDYLADPDKKITDTFGYQRPNYDMVASVDEVHGEFRGSLRDMLINRIFSHRPVLGSDFLEINPSEVNDIFINRNPDDDVFIGHLAFRITPKRPLPRVHVAGIK